MEDSVTPMERQARKATPSRIPAIFARATLPWLLVALFAPSFGAAPAHAQKAMALKGVDTPEPGSVEAIKRFTTDPRFLNPWVAYVPESSTVPSPTDFLGHVADAAGELSNTTRIYGYFRALAEASPRVRVSVIGMSEEGRDILLVTIADEAGLRDLDRLKEATNALADPRVTSPEEADRVIATARPIYYLNAGLHSSETGSPEMVMEMAYRIAVSEEPMIQRIRERLIVLINPVSEPDGRDRQVDWFYRHLKGKTDFRNLPPRSPPYWGKYVYHDNNRDTHQKALQLTQAVHETFYEYRPTVVHDLHESLPLLHTWNGTGPYNVNLDPILITEWFETSLAEVAALTAFGMPGGRRGPSARRGATTTWSRSRSTTTAWARGTRPSATAPPRPSSGSCPHPAATREEHRRHRSNGTGPCPSRAGSSGRSATTPTTCRRDASPLSTTPRATRTTCSAISIARDTTRGARGSTRSPTPS